LRILILGRTGQLGRELHRTLATFGEVIALDFPQIDLTRADSIRLAMKDAQPEVIINATAYTAVDQAESGLDIAMLINGRAPG
jgi:dTDP-4-dehydrorhamnose reductase